MNLENREWVTGDAFNPRRKRNGLGLSIWVSGRQESKKIR